MPSRQTRRSQNDWAITSPVATLIHRRTGEPRRNEKKAIHSRFEQRRTMGPHQGCCQEPRAESRLLASRRKPAHVRVGHAQIFVRVDRNVVDTNFVVEVGAGAASAVPDVADGVATVYVLPGKDCKAGQMSVASRDSMAVVQGYGASVAAQEIGKLYYALCRSHHRLAVRRADVHPGVERAFAVKWINALAKRSRDRAFNRPHIRRRVGSQPVGGGHVACESKR